MSLFDFYHPVLRALEDGRAIRKAVALALRIFAILVAIGGIVLLVSVLKLSFALPSTAATLGGVVFSLILLVTSIAVAQIYSYRATSIDQLADTQFNMIPIFSILLRATGETYATAGVAVGVGGCLLTWLSGLNPMQMLPGFGDLLPTIRAEGSFLGGLGLLVYLVTASLFILVLFYFLAESVVVVADIARNVRHLRNQSEASSAARA